MGFLRSDIRWLLYLESYSEPGLERVVLGHLGRCQALILSLWPWCISLISPLHVDDSSNVDSLRTHIQLARRDSNLGCQLPPFIPASGVDG